MPQKALSKYTKKKSAQDFMRTSFSSWFEPRKNACIWTLDNTYQWLSLVSKRGNQIIKTHTIN